MTADTLAHVEAGAVFGRLTVLRQSDTKIGLGYPWLCLCSCGKEHLASAHQLRRGMTRSCGCLRRGVMLYALNHESQPEYYVWREMKQRCGNPRSKGCATYGARGITVCEKWRESFEAFLSDMRPRPTPQHSIDRINTKGNYEPGNCRWATVTEQNRNHPRAKLTLDKACELLRRKNAGESLDALCRAFGVSKRSVWETVSGRRWKDATP